MAEIRPKIAIPARYSEKASALRHRAVVVARLMAEAVFDAGGDPIILLPSAPDGKVADDEVAARLSFADGLLLPGGGDLSPEFYGAGMHPSLYDLNIEQDAFDIACAKWALANEVPLLAICRGQQVVNATLGGTLIQDMHTHHRHVVSDLLLTPGTTVYDAFGLPDVEINCYHHQAIDRLGEGLVASARGDDGVIEATEFSPPRAGWYLGLQWHPEDTAAVDPRQQAVFNTLVKQARLHRDRQRGGTEGAGLAASGVIAGATTGVTV